MKLPILFVLLFSYSYLSTLPQASTLSLSHSDKRQNFLIRYAETQKNDENLEETPNPSATELAKLEELAELPTGFSYYKVVSFAFLKNVILKDILIAYGLPMAAAYGYKFYIDSTNPGMKFIGDVLLSPLALLSARFLLNEFLAYLLSFTGSIGKFLTYSNGSFFPSTKIFYIDYFCVYFYLQHFTSERYFYDTLSQYVTKVKILLKVNNSIFKSYRKSFQKQFLAVLSKIFPFRFKLRNNYMQVLIVNFFIYLTPLFSRYYGALCFIYFAYSDWKVNITSIFTVLLDLIFCCVLLFNQGIELNQYNGIFYPKSDLKASLGIYALFQNFLVYLIRDIGISVLLPFVVVYFLFDKFIDPQFEKVLLTVNAVIQKAFPSVSYNWKYYAACLGFAKMFLSFSTNLSAFILKRHFPFPLSRDGSFSVNWRLFGCIDLLVIWHAAAILSFYFMFAFLFNDTKTDSFRSRYELIFSSILDLKFEKKSSIALSNVLAFNYRAETDDLGYVDYVQKIEGNNFVIRYFTAYGTFALSVLFILFTLLPKYFAFCVLLGILAFSYFKNYIPIQKNMLAKEHFKKSCSLLTPYAASMAFSSIPLMMNYDDTVAPEILIISNTVEDVQNNLSENTENKSASGPTEKASKKEEELLEDGVKEKDPEKDNEAEKEAGKEAENNSNKNPAAEEEEVFSSVSKSGSSKKKDFSKAGSRKSGKKSDAQASVSVVAIYCLALLLI